MEESIFIERESVMQFSAADCPVFVVNNSSSSLKYVKYNVRKNEEGFSDLSEAVTNELNLKKDFEMYDKNGNKIYNEDFHHLRSDSIIYVTPRGVEFSYENLLTTYEKVKKLGEGGYGSVYLYRNKLNHEVSAVKLVHIPQSKTNAAQIQKVLKEASYLLTMDHENIINIDTVFLHNPNRSQYLTIYMFTEYMPGGELKKYLLNSKSP